MSFDSPGYLMFLPMTVLFYRLCPKERRWCVLLAASCFFYMQWSVRLSALIFGVIALTWGAGLLIGRTQSMRMRRWILGISTAGCLALLGYFKYFTFLTESLSSCGVSGWVIARGANCPLITAVRWQTLTWKL